MDELSREELDAQVGEQLPDREAMTVLDPGPLAGGVHDLELPPMLQPEGEGDPTTDVEPDY